MQTQETVDACMNEQYKKQHHLIAIKCSSGGGAGLMDAACNVP